MRYSNKCHSTHTLLQNVAKYFFMIGTDNWLEGDKETAELIREQRVNLKNK